MCALVLTPSGVQNLADVHALHSRGKQKPEASNVLVHAIDWHACMRPETQNPVFLEHLGHQIACSKNWTSKLTCWLACLLEPWMPQLNDAVALVCS